MAPTGRLSGGGGGGGSAVGCGAVVFGGGGGGIEAEYGVETSVDVEFMIGGGAKEKFGGGAN